MKCTIVNLAQKIQRKADIGQGLLEPDAACLNAAAGEKGSHGGCVGGHGGRQ